MENNILASGTYITAKGNMLIAKLVAAQTELEFTRAAVGTGRTPEGIMPDVLTNLNAYKMDAEISDYGIEGDKAYVNVQLSSENIVEGFLVTEVGIFAMDPDEGEILYAYMDISADPTYMYANGSSSMVKFAEFMMYVVIGGVEKVTAIITPGSFVNKRDLEKRLNPILNPEFDDSGEVEGITSLENFDATVKSKMSLFEFFRNLKAGLKFMLGLGSIVNNGTTTIAGKFVLDAIQANPNVAGTLAATLKQAQTDISSLNSNMGGLKIRLTEYTPNFDTAVERFIIKTPNDLDLTRIRSILATNRNGNDNEPYIITCKEGNEKRWWAIGSSASKWNIYICFIIFYI